MFEVVTKLVVATKSATTEEETKRQRLGQQLEMLLQKVHHFCSSHHKLVGWHQRMLEPLDAYGVSCTIPVEKQNSTCTVYLSFMTCYCHGCIGPTGLVGLVCFQLQ